MIDTLVDAFRPLPGPDAVWMVVDRASHGMRRAIQQYVDDNVLYSHCPPVTANMLAAVGNAGNKTRVTFRFGKRKTERQIFRRVLPRSRAPTWDNSAPQLQGQSVPRASACSK